MIDNVLVWRFSKIGNSTKLVRLGSYKMLHIYIDLA